jgi:hypothetical protein
MGQTTDPEQEEVLGYMRRTGASPIEAVRHFFPGVSPEQQRQKAKLFSKWMERQRAAGGGTGNVATPQGTQRPQGPPPAAPPTDDPRYDLADQPLIAQLRELLATAWTDLETARRARDHRGAAVHRTAIAELGAQLEALRLKAARAVKVEQTASAVAAELARKQPAIDLRAERERRRAARAAQAAAETPKEREL